MSLLRIYYEKKRDERQSLNIRGVQRSNLGHYSDLNSNILSTENEEVNKNIHKESQPQKVEEESLASKGISIAFQFMGDLLKSVVIFSS